VAATITAAATATMTSATTTTSSAAATVGNDAGSVTTRRQSDGDETYQREPEELDSHGGPHFCSTVSYREAQANAEGGKADARRGRAASGLCPSPRLSAAKPFSRWNYSTLRRQMMRFCRKSPTQSLQTSNRKLFIPRASCLRRRLVAAAIVRPCRGNFGTIMAVV
jgi:hypothetical protein